MLQDHFLETRSQIFQPLQPNKNVVTYNFPYVLHVELPYILRRLKCSKH